MEPEFHHCVGPYPEPDASSTHIYTQFT